MFFSHESSNSAGVAIIFKPNKNVNILNVNNVVPGRLLHIHAEVDDFPVHLINVYAPSNGFERLEFFKVLKHYLNSLNNDPLVVGGDFNCTLCPENDRADSPEPHSLSSNFLSNILQRFKLVDTWRQCNTLAKQFTWSRNESKSRIDTFYISKSIVSRIKSSSIEPHFNFSDHCLVTLCLSFKSIGNRNPVWCFNSSLLQDEVFCEIVNNYWLTWRNEKSRFNTIQLWWDIGKLKIKDLTKQYTSKLSNNYKRTKHSLQREINNFEQQLPTNPALVGLLNEKKSSLENLVKTETKGAAIRSRHRILNYNDAPTSFFFDVEKQKGRKKMMSQLLKHDGTLTETPNEMREITRDFYCNLFSPDPVSLDCQQKILSDLPQLDNSLKENCDAQLSYEELTAAVKLISTGKSPGIDGLPGELYQHFWPILGTDLHEVLLASIEAGELPLSCRRAVITLLPKKGDNNLLKNWRPVSLLCADYKIFTKALSLRLKPTLSNIIHVDQSYSVPGRQIFDNISLVRDVITYANNNNITLGIVSLDQEKAFDRVHHEYLLNTLKAFGFGEKFTKYIKLLYAQTQSLVRVNSNLTAPLPFARGIRQGCSLSGQLYAICIEPLLHKVRTESGVQGLQVGPSRKETTNLTAYADDVSFFLTSNNDFYRLQEWLSIYERASNSRINYAKSQGLWVGRWKTRTDMPLNIKWNNKGLKVLGTFLGNTPMWLDKNWSDIIDKIESKLDWWARYAPSMSYRGRTLVINQLIASKLLHRLVCLCPPTMLINNIQKLFVNFFWQGRHWLPAETIYLPPSQGGQGLIHLPSRIASFRLQYIQRYFYSNLNHPCFYFTSYFLKRFNNLKYDKQLFVTNVPLSFVNIPVYYCELMKVWSSVPTIRKGQPTTYYSVCQEPLFYNSVILHPLHNVPLTLTHFREAGITTIGDLVTGTTWLGSDTLHDRVRIYSKRLLNIALDVVHRAIPDHFKNIINNHSENNTEVTESPYSLELLYQDEDNNILLNCPLYKLQKRVIYKFIISTHYFSKHITYSYNVWTDILSLKKEHQPMFSDCYLTPISKKDGDLQWRLLHGAYPTGGFLRNARFQDTDNCRFCEDKEDLLHIFLECPRLTRLFVIFKEIIHTLLDVDSVPLSYYVLGPPRRKTITQTHRILCYLCVAVKTAIHITRYKKINGDSHVCVVRCFTTRLRHRIQNEYNYHSLTKSLNIFEAQWCINGAVARLDEDMLCFSDVLDNG